MVASMSWSTASAAALLLLSASLKPARAVMPQELMDRKLPDCEDKLAEDWDSIQDKGTFWYNTGAEQFAEDFISSHSNGDHTEWAAELLEDIIPKYAKADFDCADPDGTCILKASCSDFNAVGKGGLYYLFMSMQNLHSFSKAYKTKLNEAAFANAQQVGNMAQFLKLPDGEADDPLDMFAIISGAASIGSALTAANPGLAGAFGVVSGATGALGQFQAKPQEVPDVGDEARATIDGMVGDSIAALQFNIAMITQAVFGQFGHKQDDIPMVMRAGGTKSPAVQVFGWGNWVKDQATAGLKDIVAKQKAKTDQALLWQMARLFKKLYVVVRTDLPMEECNSPNNAWDNEKSRCLDMLSWNGNSDATLGGANDLNEIWGTYAMDPYTTLRNAVDCWEASGGKVGTVVPNQDWASESPPLCFFGMEVLKGSYSDIQKGTIWMSGDFPGQEGFNDEKLWPQNKCLEALEKGDEACNYKWGEEEEGAAKRSVVSFR